MNVKINSAFKNISSIDWKLFSKFIFWGCLCIILTVFLILIIDEKDQALSSIHNAITINGIAYTNINDIRNAIGNGTIVSSSDLVLAYNTIISWTNYSASGTFRIIGFSLLWFIPGTSNLLSTTLPSDAWNTRWNNITLAYSYFFITLGIALVGFVLMFFNSFKDVINNHRNKKLNINPIPVGTFNYQSFTFKNITDFVINLAIVFAFFNFLSTLVVIGYWLFLFITNIFIKHITKNKLIFDISSFEVSKSDMYYLFAVMIYQTTYTLLRSYFINEFGVNLDIIMQIVLPVGTVTCIVGLFIKNLMSSKMTNVKKQIMGITTVVEQLRVFIILKGTSAFNDYDFVSLIPTFIKNEINNSKIIDNDRMLEQFKKYDSLINLIEKNIKKIMNKKYLMYVATYICKNEIELDIFKTNIEKISSVYKPR